MRRAAEVDSKFVGRMRNVRPSCRPAKKVSAAGVLGGIRQDVSTPLRIPPRWPVSVITNSAITVTVQ